MNLRLPLYTRILGLFLLNVVVIAAVFLVVFRMQFSLGLDSILAGQANRRVQALSQAVIGELREAPVSETDRVVKRFSQAFGLDLYVFRTTGEQLAGESIVLPRQVERNIRRQAGGRGRGGPGIEGMGPLRGPRTGQQPPLQQPRAMDVPVVDFDGVPSEFQPEPPFRRPGSEDNRRPGQRWQEGLGRQGIPPSFFIKSTEPTRYWAGTFFPSRERTNGGPPHVLLIVSSSLTGGGLFFDLTPWVVTGLGGLVLSALIWLPFVRSITGSLAQMTRTTGEISVGRFDARVTARRSDELGQLAMAINEMAGRLEGFVNGQRRFLGDIAHELCSPLARIQTALGILEQRADERDQSYVKDLQEEAEHMARLVGELLSFSKASIDQAKVQLAPISAAEIATTAVRREQIEAVVIEQSVPSELTVKANAELLQRALANLLRNAIHHAGQAGPITVAGWQDGDDAVLEVTDCGPGVPDESLPRLFDPFYRVDPSRTRETGGVGLGMTIVKTSVESCHGTVAATNRPEGGLRVQIRLKAV